MADEKMAVRGELCNVCIDHIAELEAERDRLRHTLTWIQARNLNRVMVPGYDSILNRVIVEALAGQMPKGIEHALFNAPNPQEEANDSTAG